MISRYKVEYGLADAATALCGLIRSPLRTPPLPGFEDHESVFTRRGREALLLILSSLDLPTNARIGIPLFACSAVAKTVAAAGMRPVFLDLDPGTYGVSLDDLSGKAEHLDAFVLVHLFGYPAPVNEVLRMMREKPVIEDCAHALGSSYQGHPLGSMSDVGFFSFGFFKPLGVGGGGCVVTRNRNLAATIRHKLENTTPSLASEMAHVLRTTAYGLMYKAPMYSLLHASRPEGIEIADDLGCTPKPAVMRSTDYATLLRKSVCWRQNLDFAEKTSRELCTKLGTPVEPSDGTWNHFILPLLASSKSEYHEIIRRMAAVGVGADALYPNSIQVAKQFGYAGGCSNAEEIAGRVFMVPSYRKLDPRQSAALLRETASTTETAHRVAA